MHNYHISVTLSYTHIQVRFKIEYIYVPWHQTISSLFTRPFCILTEPNSKNTIITTNIVHNIVINILNCHEYHILSQWLKTTIQPGRRFLMLLICPTLALPFLITSRCCSSLKGMNHKVNKIDLTLKSQEMGKITSISSKCIKWGPCSKYQTKPPPPPHKMISTSPWVYSQNLGSK